MVRMKNHRPPLREERILRMLRSSCWNRKSFRAAVEFREVLRDTGWLLVQANNSPLTDEYLILRASLDVTLIRNSKRDCSETSINNQLTRLHR